MSDKPKNNKLPGKVKKRNKQPDKLFTSKHYLVLFTCVAITFIVYLPALSNGWTSTWDDAGYVTNNKLTQNLSFNTLGDFFSTYQMGNYHPLAMLSLAVDYRLFGTEASGYHIHSVLLHLVNVVLVFVFINLLTKKLWTSAIAAFLFGIHPAHIESVAWISERKDLLYVFYYLAALISYLVYISGRKRIFYLLTMLLFILSLFSKGQAVTFSIVLLLIDYYFNRPFDRKVRMEKIPFFAISIFFGIIAILAQQKSRAFTMVSHSLTERMFFASYSLITYLYKAILPLHLSSFYTYPNEMGGHYSLIMMICPFLVILLMVIIIYSIKRNKDVFFGLIFFMVNIILILQILPVGSAMMADRYTYLSYIGLFFIIGTFVEQLISGSFTWVTKVRIPGFVLLSLMFIFFSVKTYSRNKVWKDSESLYKDMLLYAGDNSLANCNLATVYRDKGLLDSSLYYYTKAIDELPAYTEALMNRGVVLSVAGKYDSAFNDFNRVLKLDTTYAMVYSDRGNLNDMKGNYDAALTDYNKALHFDSSNHDVYINRGRTYLHKGNVDEALKDFTLSIKYQPNNCESYFLRSNANNAKGYYRQALDDALMAKNKGKIIDGAYIEFLEAKINGH